MGPGIEGHGGAGTGGHGGGECVCVRGGLKQGSTRKKGSGNQRKIAGGKGDPCVEPGFRPA